MAIDEYLSICPWKDCGKIKVSQDSDMWLSREMDSNLYNDYMKKYEGKLSHVFCPEHREEFSRKYD